MAKFELPKQASDLLADVEGLEARAQAARKMVEDDLKDLRHIAASRRDELGHRELALGSKQEEIESERSKVDEERRQVHREREAANALISDPQAGFAIVGEAWADYQRALAESEAVELEYKSRPAPKAAEAIREKGRQVAEATRRAKAAEWAVALYEWHLPWITELREEAEHDAYIEEEGDEADPSKVDPARRWLSKQEWVAIPEGQRNQMALERYLRSRQSPWQLGRDYERYVGYLREQAGCKVTYHGIAKGLEDLGRDVLDG
jgi:hypothetical protein